MEAELVFIKSSRQIKVRIIGAYLGDEITIKDYPTHLEISQATIDDYETYKAVKTKKGFTCRARLDIAPGNYEPYMEDETLFIDKVDIL